MPTRQAGSGRHAAPRQSRRNFEPRYLRLAIEGSLRRLGTDYLDIFYLHSPPPEVVADEAVFRTLEQLQGGSVRHYGISFSERTTTDQVLAAFQHPGVSIVQVKASPLEAVDLGRITAKAREKKVAVVARQPFDRGIAFETPELSRVLARQGYRTPAQTLLRSALQSPGVDVVLVGMRTREHLDENLGALSAPPLSTDELRHLLAGTRIL